MPSKTPTTVSACPLLCACGVAYDIGLDNPLSRATPFYAGVGYVAGSTPIVCQGILPETSACVIGVAASAIVVAFRGTLFTSPADVLTDLMAAPSQPTGWPGPVHTGFFLSLMEIMPAITSAVTPLMKQNPKLPLVITGHSKGGGMASLAAWYLQANQVAAADNIFVTTFASPAPGTSVFAEAYQKVFDQSNYINYLDIIPFLPPDANLAHQLAGLYPNNTLWTDVIQAFVSWDYLHAASSNYFILEDGTISTFDAHYLGFEADLKTALEAKDYSRIMAAHYHGCPTSAGSPGYMTAVCPGVCPVPAPAPAPAPARAPSPVQRP